LPLEAERPRIAAVAPGPPFDPETWSGSSAYLLRALAAAGVLAGAVDGGSRALDRVEQLASFSPAHARWRQRYHTRSSPLSPATRAARGVIANRRLAALAGDADVLLQIGAWHDVTRMRAGRLCCSYHDGNLAVSLAREELALDRGSRSVKRALDAERRLYERLDLIMPMSEWLRRSFVDDLGQDPAKVVTVGAGANLAIPPEPQRSFERPVFLFVGKQWERKGGPDVLDAFELVRAERPDAELVVVGPEQLPRDAEGVRFLGRISRGAPGGEAGIDQAYRAATTFVMPSRYEPFGIVFLEAMAYRLPCIASTRCAMPEIVADGTTGYVVPAGDPEALAERMLALAEPAHARELGAAGHKRLLEHFTWERVAEKIVAAICERLP
jgi:glycosyltransferase involved in cell wall biosynthesis